MGKKIDWIIHCCANGYCEECGKVEIGFLPFLCNAHTHGMARYGHVDFQLVLRLPNEEIMYILNTLGLMVQSGRQFCDGDMVSGIFEDCDVRLMKCEETGRQVLRVIIPDKYNHFPEEPCCMAPYCLQLLETDDLCVGGQML